MGGETVAKKPMKGGGSKQVKRGPIRTPFKDAIAPTKKG
jgi:hypothetical protein